MQDFAALILAWFQHAGRKTLPWQQVLEPYPVWISEIMLQQTQVKTVIPYFTRFMERFPNLEALAQAPVDDVLKYCAGLGYYARARNLHKMAYILVTEYGGKFPRELDALQKLPGLGRSTASAILAICHGKALPILDGNVKRVLTRYLGISGYPGDKKIEARLWQEAERLLPPTDIPAYTQAIMDVGALICTSKHPACLLCPVQANCVALREGQVEILPTPKPKTHYPTKKAYFLILTDGQHLHLEKRPSPGIWGGLSCLPELETLDTIPFKEYTLLAERTHLFTHYRLIFTPVLVHVQALQAGIPIKALADYGLPAPIKLLLEAVFGDYPACCQLLDPG